MHFESDLQEELVEQYEESLEGVFDNLTQCICVNDSTEHMILLTVFMLAEFGNSHVKYLIEDLEHDAQRLNVEGSDLMRWAYDCYLENKK